jgi:hypothetical protein
VRADISHESQFSGKCRLGESEPNSVLQFPWFEVRPNQEISPIGFFIIKRNRDQYGCRGGFTGLNKKLGKWREICRQRPKNQINVEATKLPQSTRVIGRDEERYIAEGGVDSCA